MRWLLLLLLIGALAVGGLTACMGEDDDGSARQERRAGALGQTETDSGGNLIEDPGGEPSPPAPPAPTAGTSNVYEFRGSAGLAQPPLGVRVAIAGVLPLGKYVLSAKINMSSVVGGTISSQNSCELKGDTDKADDVVLDKTLTTHTGTVTAWATTMLSAIHQVTSSGEVKVVCLNANGGTIGSRVLTALKVG